MTPLRIARTVPGRLERIESHSAVISKREKRRQQLLSIYLH
jgi:hypothetical protein